MAKKKRQRISYVLPLASTPGGHRLGVNGLSFDENRNILYTGGRDGVICAWNLDLDAEYAQQEKSLPTRRNTASFRQLIQAHTHWVNDLVLVKNNLAVVSASSDASVKLWRPHSTDASTAHTIGSHSDYIKCLSCPDRNSNWIASGGLDHRIKLWDLSGAGERLEIDVKKADSNVKAEKSSVYALQANRAIIASGGPESVVRIWDVNSGKGVTKLVGHTDNIRDILISEDGDTILTASSDQTVKVWSIAAGRCLHTLTMHNDSVWCMYSDDPTLSVFYSGDRSGLVAKTDTRRAMEIEEGVSVAVCQEHDGIARIALAGDSVWTSTSSSSINRWKDVDTELEVETPPPSPRYERRQSAVARSMHSQSIRSQSIASLTPSSSPPTPTTNRFRSNRIPHNAILQLSNNAIHPGRKQTERNYSVTNLRKPSEAIHDPGLIFVHPIRGHPEETIEGQNGLTKHIILNDKKRVLTIDTAGEVVLWDLLECIPIKAFGRRHLDEVVSEVNTQENVANWCTVDTKTGQLTVMLEENYCFDAELYADELNIKQNIDFREDQRINLGKWVLRNLFSMLLDEELRRDETYRRTFRTTPPASTTIPSLNGIQRLGAPTKILLPESSQTTPMVSPGTVVTPRANGKFLAATPGLAIGLATPGGPSTNGYSPLTRAITNSIFPPTIQEDTTPGQPLSPSSQLSPTAKDQFTDYFSSTRHTENAGTPSESGNNTQTPAAELSSAVSPTSPTDEKKKSLFGKKFQMNFPKKLGRTSSDAAKNAAPATASEEKSEDSDRSSEKDAPQLVIEDNFYGVIQRIRHSYVQFVESQPDETLPPGITPSLPAETPVLKPPPHTLIIIQEDDPESGGLLDLYRGKISTLGHEADIVEKVAPAWLGELLLRNQIPDKDTVKVSFVLHPYEDKLPHISPADGNARLNANRMLRAKKILAYIAERIDPVPTTPVQVTQADGDGTMAMIPAPPQPPPMRPEEYLELICQGQKVDPNITLGTLRVHVWRVGGDVVLYYRANGKKEIKIPHPADVAGRDEGMGQVVTNA